MDIFERDHFDHICKQIKRACNKLNKDNSDIESSPVNDKEPWGFDKMENYMCNCPAYD